MEIGPGPGWAGINLLKKRKDLSLVGLEASLDMFRVAENNAKTEGLLDRITYLHGNGEDMKEISNHQYDLVISRESLHHWVNPENVFREF